MAKDIDEVAKIAVGTKAKIEELDKDVSSRFLLFIQSWIKIFPWRLT